MNPAAAFGEVPELHPLAVVVMVWGVLLTASILQSLKRSQNG